MKLFDQSVSPLNPLSLLTANFTESDLTGGTTSTLGFDPRQHIANFIHHVPQQQPATNDMLHSASAAKGHSQSQQSQHTTTKIKQQRNSQSCNQTQPQTGPHLLTTAIAFPGNPLQHNSQPQQHLQPQQQQQQHAILIPATASAASQVRNVSSVSFNNNTAATVWMCPACKIPYKSASELQAHLRYDHLILIDCHL